MSINNQSIESKSFKAFAISVNVVLKGSWVRLSKTINIKDGDQVVQLVDTCKVQSFPNGAFSALAITNEAVNTIWCIVKVFANVGHASSDTQPLSEGASSHINKVESWSRVSFQVRINLTQVQQILGWK